MALAHFQRTFTGPTGVIQPGISVTVRNESTGAMAAIYIDKEGQTSAGNPLKTDATGYLSFYAKAGRYRITGPDIDWRNEDLVTFEALDEAVDQATMAADAATLNAGIYASTNDGIVATSDGDYFNVPSAAGDEYLILYRNDAGVATVVDTYPNKQAVDDVNTGLADVNADLADVNAALDERVLYVDSIADLLALNTAALKDGQQVSVLSYHAPVWGVAQFFGGGVFAWDATSTEADNGGTVFEVAGVAGGRWKRRDSGVGRIKACWFGLRGDGSDELSGMRALASYASSTKRGVDFESGRTYKYSDFVYFNDAGVLDFQNSLVIFEHSGNSTGMQLKGQTGVRNSRHQNNGTPAGTLGPAGQRDIVALDVKHTEFRNIRFVSGSNNYAPFNILGNSYDLDVENIEFEDAQWDMGCIIHWATVSDSAATDYTTGIQFSPGAGNNTTHPHNIRVSNIEGGVFDTAGALVSQLFISGCYDIDAVNVISEEVNRVVTVIAGDYGIAFAPAAVSRFIGSGINITNPTCNQITGTEGIMVSGKGDLTSNVLKMDVTIKNPQIRRTLAATSYGIRVDNVSGVYVLGGRVLGFSRSIFGQRNVKGFTAEGTTISESRVGGVLFDSDEDANTGITLSNLKVHSNNTSSDASLAASGVVFRNTKGAKVRGCFFGLDGETEGQQHSVYVQDGCDDITLSDNHTYASAQTSAYSGELVTQYSMKLWDGGGNTSDSAFIFRPDTHVWYRPLAFNSVQVLLNQTNSAPSSGTWATGDEAVFRNPPAGGFRGAVCTAGGSPGTWKRYGAVEA